MGGIIPRNLLVEMLVSVIDIVHVVMVINGPSSAKLVTFLLSLRGHYASV